MRFKFYENLKFFISYTQLPGEAHIIERALYTLWTSNFEVNENMLKPIQIAEGSIFKIKKVFSLKNIFNKLYNKIIVIFYIVIMKKFTLKNIGIIKSIKFLISINLGLLKKPGK